MLHHGYAPHYARHLNSFRQRFSSNFVIAEFGILRGSGLAIWCDLFPTARVIGFDIDLGHFEQNRPRLLERGAFSQNSPEVFEFDQYSDGSETISTALGQDRISVVIDDATHSDVAILRTFDSVLPFLSDNFLYFIEDNAGVHELLREKFPDFRIEAAGELTIVTRTSSDP